MSLIEKITSDENIYSAIECIKSNSGSKTPGVDGKTIENIIANIKEVVHRIKTELSDGKYFASDIRRINIPKGNGETRPLGIPIIYDRVVQQCIKQVIEPIIDRKFHPNSFGFRPGRSPEHAIAQNNNLINIAKFHFVVDIDIKGFFENINHNKLIKQLRAIGIKENKLISIIKEMLKAKTKLPTGEIIQNSKGVPQGGVLSPLLANVVLNELDWWIDRQWTGMKLEREYSNTANKEKSLRIRTKLDEVKIVRYADDFKLYCRSIGVAQKFFKLTKLFLRNKLKLEISEKKSKIVNLRKQSSEFLGIRITTIKNRDRRTVRTFISNKAKMNIKRTIAKAIKELNENRNKSQAQKYNTVIAGIQNYYRIATMVSQDMAKIGYNMGRKLKNLFGKRNYTKDASYCRRYKNYNFKVWNVAGVTLYTIAACKYKIVKSYSAKKQKFDLMDEELKETSNLKAIEWEKIKSKLRFLRNSTCEITKEYIGGRDKFYVHHILPKEKGGTDEMDNLILLKYEFKKLLTSKNAKEYLPENQMYQKLLKTISK